MFFFRVSDSCLVQNGGCDVNAACSHDAKCFAVVCTCKTGYTNVGKDVKVVCQGNNELHAQLIAYHLHLLL